MFINHLLLIPFFLLILTIAVELKTKKGTNESVGQEEFKQYAKEKWENFEKEMEMVSTWLNHQHAQSRAEEVVQVLLYISRLDEPIYVGVELLRTIDKSGTLLERTKKVAKKTANANAKAAAANAITNGQEEHHETERTAVAFMLGMNGVEPLYAKMRPDNETMEEQLEMGKMIVHIVRTAKVHRTRHRRRLFHEIVGEVFAASGLKKATNWSQDMYKRITKWDGKANDQIHQLSLKKVAVGLRDVALWLICPENVSGVIQLLLYFTNLGTPLKLAFEVISALGLDESFTKIATKMGVKMAQNGVNQNVAMWAFGPNGLLPLFLRQGQKVDAAEVMDSIDHASLWYYYEKQRIDATQTLIRCTLKIHTGDDADERAKKCEWKMRQQKWGRTEQTEKEEETEKMNNEMEKHMKSKHPKKHEEKQKAQRKKEEIIRRADIWHYFQKDEKIGIVKCKLPIITYKMGAKMVDKCKWKIEIGKANESELNDHLSLEHLAEFEQRLKAKREKELPIRDVHEAPLANSLTLIQRVTMSLVLNKGRPMDQLVDIVIERLHNWHRNLVKRWKRRWERVKRIQFRDVYEAFKQAAMWLITPSHINRVIKVLFIITMLDAPIYLTVEILRAFGIQRYLFKKLDTASRAIQKRYEGTTTEKALLFAIGEGGVVRLFLEGEHKSDVSPTGAAELLHTVIMSVVHNPGKHTHALAYTTMEQLREFRLELSLVRGWNNHWPQIKERYDEVRKGLNTKRVEKIGEQVRQNVATDLSDESRWKLKQIVEEDKEEQNYLQQNQQQQKKLKEEYEKQDEDADSDVSVEILYNWPSNISEASSSRSNRSSSIISIESGVFSLDSDSSEHSVILDDDDTSIPIEYVEDHWHDCDDSFVPVEHVDDLPNEMPDFTNEISTLKKPQNSPPKTKTTSDKVGKAKKQNAKGCSNSISKLFKLLKSPKKANGSSSKTSETENMANQQKQEEQQPLTSYLLDQKLNGQGTSFGGSFADYRDSDESVPSVIIVDSEQEKADCPKEMGENWGPMPFSELLRRSDEDKCRTVQILRQKFEVVPNFLNEAIETIMGAESEGEIPPVINLRLGNKISFKKQRIFGGKTNKVKPVSVSSLSYKMGQIGINFDDDDSTSAAARPLEYAFVGPKDKKFILLLPANANDGTISQFAIFKSDYFGERLNDFSYEIPIEGDSD
ncbi:hypothetical protein niasHT_000346 [Heterodera trifolii]|uniref:Uncharacterized protein n=1 Tax=Heterodera trifolii TaxID=157864 RepID=A0ABD2MC47_9BILA